MWDMSGAKFASRSMNLRYRQMLDEAIGMASNPRPVRNLASRIAIKSSFWFITDWMEYWPNFCGWVSSELHRTVGMVDCTYNHAFCAGHQALRTHHNRCLFETLDIGDADQTCAKV